MKVGDLVKLYDDRVGIIMAYHTSWRDVDYEHNPNGYPWYVWVNGKIQYYQAKHLELV